MNKACYAALAAVGATFAFQPSASAAPLPVAPLAIEQSNLIAVQGRGEMRRSERGGPRGFQGGQRGVQGAQRGGPRVVYGGQHRGGPRVVQGSPRVVHGGQRVYRSAPRVVHGGPRIVHRGGYAYWGPHRGYRVYRPGYHLHHGWWFPPAAFAAGAIIGGALAGHTYAAPVGVAPGLSAAHYAWCDQRYISYRASDNTFQPYHGPRQQCISPYS